MSKLRTCSTVQSMRTLKQKILKNCLRTSLKTYIAKKELNFVLFIDWVVLMLVLWSQSRTFSLEPEPVKMSRQIITIVTKIDSLLKSKIIFLYFSKLNFLFKFVLTFFFRSREPEPATWLGAGVGLDWTGSISLIDVMLLFILFYL